MVAGYERLHVWRTGARLNIKTVFPRYLDSHVKDEMSWDRLIINIGIPILIGRHLYIETASRVSFYCKKYRLGSIRISIIKLEGLATRPSYLYVNRIFGRTVLILNLVAMQITPCVSNHFTVFWWIYSDWGSTIWREYTFREWYYDCQFARNPNHVYTPATSDNKSAAFNNSPRCAAWIVDYISIWHTSGTLGAR